MTRDAYGPVMGLSCWAKEYPEPLYLVSTMDAAEAACRYDHKRFRIETFSQTRKAGVSIFIRLIYLTLSASRDY